MKHLTRFSIFADQYLYPITIISHNATSHRINLIRFPHRHVRSPVLTTTSSPYPSPYPNSRHARDVHYFSSPRIDYAIVKNQLRSSSLIIWDRDASERGGDDGGRRSRSNGGERWHVSPRRGKERSGQTWTKLISSNNLKIIIDVN